MNGGKHELCGGGEGTHWVWEGKEGGVQGITGLLWGPIRFGGKVVKGGGGLAGKGVLVSRREISKTRTIRGKKNTIKKTKKKPWKGGAIEAKGKL